MSETNKQLDADRGNGRKTLDMVLVARGMTAKSLAPLTGIGYRTLLASISKGVPEIRFRHRIEAATGWLPIWSPLVIVELRRQCFLKYQFDPYLLDVPELKAKIASCSMRSTTAKLREELIDHILQHIAANPTPVNK
jgi:hypothetical protein